MFWVFEKKFSVNLLNSFVAKISAEHSKSIGLKTRINVVNWNETKFSIHTLQLNVRHDTNSNLEWPVSIGNSTVSRGIWEKYREWYFKIHQNITSRRRGEWYLGVLKYHETVFIPNTPKKPCYFLFILQAKEISHFI